ncbi:MAG TPA: PIN domain-containing protein [Solirubrobacterales bacterium]|nr:PIN domain-containing protein [Solirubrobacterales bacterium]
MAVVLDSAAIVAFLDRDDALHEAAAEAIGEHITEEPLLASVVSFAEVLTGAHLLHHDEALVRGFFADLVAEILSVEVGTAERAAELRSANKSLRMPDALIAATADGHPDADLLLTGDSDLAAVHDLGCRVRLLR